MSLRITMREVEALVQELQAISPCLLPTEVKERCNIILKSMVNIYDTTMSKWEYRHRFAMAVDALLDLEDYDA